jgi:hypothetical protein
MAGCIGLPWVKTDGPYVAPPQNVSVELPKGWMRHNSKKHLLVTRDGPRLQYILVERIHVDAKLKHTKKKFRKGMLPQELAEVIIDHCSANENVLNFKVKSNKPTKINGHSGFRLLFTYKDGDDLKYKSLYYGFMEQEWFYGIRYNAPERYYYDKELKTFKEVLASLELAN